MAKKKSRSTVAKGVGAAVVVAFLIGMYTGIPGFGGGSGAQGNAAITSSGSGGGPIEATDDLTETGLEDNVLTVLIDESKFSVLTKRDGAEKYSPATMEQVVSLAKTAEGDQTGVRVKVLRRESAWASAEEELKSSLVSGGIPASAIYWPKQLLP